MARIRSLLGVAVVIVGSLVVLPPAATAAPAYLSVSTPVTARVADLLHRMTLNEKVGQLEQIAVPRVQGDCNGSGGELTTTCMREVLVGDAVGSLLSGGGMGPATNTPRDWAVMTNALQRFAIEQSRLHIPIVYGLDAVHGHSNVLGATLFPQQIGLGATWDPPLVTQTTSSTRRAMLATGANWDFAPVADQPADPRWGRFYEGFAEDPVLAGTLAAGAVTGIQDAAGGSRVAATVKHFAGNFAPVNGHDRVQADLSARTLQDTVLPSYRAAIRAGARAVMANDGVLNGVPGTASHYMLTDVLRRQWHFDGVVVSDWNAVRNLQTVFHTAADYPAAIALAINAGIDVAMLPHDDRDFHPAILAAVQRRLIPMSRIDEAVGRVLALKFSLGLFDHPYVDPEAANATVLGADTALARRAATESMVLLRNSNQVLPIGANASRIVVTGPSADSMPRQLGGWSIGWQGVPAGVTVPGTTILAGIRQGAPAGTQVDYAPDAADAVARTHGASLAVVVVGEAPGAEGLADNPRPALPIDQQDLVRTLRDTGTPVVVVVVSGRPLVLGDADGTAGLLMAWLPGTEGGHAVADVLFGNANPGGRMPVSWPRALGSQPQTYLQLPGPFGSDEARYNPLFPFGAGLSYTTFTTGGITATVSPNAVTAQVTVANTGARAGDLVVPVYVGRPVSSDVAPAQRLVGYTRLTLAAGETRTVAVSVPPDRFAVTGGDVLDAGPARVERGIYRLGSGGAFTDVVIG
jgi:beta-glucosidase